MKIEEALKQLQKNGIKTLNIYWLEAIENGEIEWWIDIMNDDLNKLCSTRWVWTIESEEKPEDTFEDWEILLFEKFSEQVILNAVKNWLTKRNFNFDVKIISSEGTKEEKRLLELLKKNKIE